MSEIIDTDDDFVDSSEQEDHASLVYAVASKAEIADKLNKYQSLYCNHQFFFDKHEAINHSFIQEAVILLMEIRILNFKHDLETIKQIRSHRPLLTILAFTSNNDFKFHSSLYEAGISDIIPEDTDPVILAKKIDVFFEYAQTGTVLEIKNNDLVRTLSTLRKTNEELRQEVAGRVTAEQQALVAEENALKERQLRDIMDNLKDGFFWVNSDCTVGDMTSLACEQIFKNPIAGQSIGNILNLKSNKEDHLKMCLEQLFENILPAVSTIGMLPTKVETMTNAILSFSYQVITNESGDAVKVIIIVSDITEQVRKQEEQELITQHNKMLVDILKNKEVFQIFIDDFRTEIEEMKNEENLVLLKRSLHTLKGNSSAHGLQRVAEITHEAEEVIDKLPDSPSLIKAQKHTFIDRIEGALESFLEENHSVLKIAAKAEKSEVKEMDRTVQIKMQQIDRIQEIIGRVKDKELHELLNYNLEELKKLPLSIFTPFFETTINTLSKKLEKRVELIVEGDEIKIHLKKIESFMKNLVHALRNSCDHGIEVPETRQERGKPEVGSIKLIYSRSELGDLCIELKDDGNGIDSSKILFKLLSTGMIKQSEINSYTTDQILKFIFSDGFSTAESVTNISGRGVGMAAIRNEVEKLDGSIRIESTPGKGTVFYFFLPYV